MIRFVSSRFLTRLLTAFLVAACGTSASAAAESASQPASNRPKLVVLIVVDQMRGDYLPRFAPHLEGGFARLMKEGADCRSTYLGYGTSATAPGHATISTGRMPRQHGISGNEWFLEPGSNKPQLPIDDADAKIVGVDENRPLGMSSVNLIGPALGDELKLSDRRSRVFSVGLKDRAAIMLGGKNPDGVFWWDLKTGRFVSSTYYMKTLPPYLAAFNSEQYPQKLVGKTWDKLLPEAAYADCHAIDPAWINDDYGIGRSFPHALPKPQASPDRAFHAAIFCTPFANEMLLEVVKRVMENEKLGADEATDLLCIAMSANDVVGHVFGSESAEIKDITLRTDRQLAGLLTLLDQQVGAGQYVLALTADHGVKPIPDLAKSLRLGGGRISSKQIVTDLEAALRKALGKPRGPRYVAGIELPWVYFDASIQKLAPETLEKLFDAATQILEDTPGIEEVFTAPDLAGPAPSPEEHEKLMAWRSFHPSRAGQIYLHLTPYWHEAGDKSTGHCTCHSHDRHIPLLLYGPGVKAGTYFTPADVVDVSVTLAALMGIEKPLDALGRPLSEALTGAR